jgi:hypothetical protein
MKRVLVSALFVACGGDPAIMNDAGVGSDASTDAAPDAPTCTGIDTDSDGICDDVDVCPQISDPGQVDLDGDGIGWACDPVESTYITNVEQNPMVEVSFWGATYAQNTFSATGVHVLGVSPKGLVSASSGTTPWMTVPTIGPFVSRDEHMFASTGDGAGLLSPAGVFTVEEASQRIASGGQSTRPLTYLRIYSLGNPATIAVPNGTQLDVLPAPTGYQSVEAARSPEGVAAFMYRHVDPVLKTTLQRWESGTTTSEEFDSLQLLDGYRLIFCAKKGSQYEVIELRPGTTFRATLPMIGCSTLIASGRPEDGYFLTGSGTTMSTKLAAVHVRGDIVTTVSSGDASAPSLFESMRVIGTSLQVLVTDTKAFAVTPTNTVTALTITSKDAVSAHADTLQFVDIVGSDAVLKRWRSATGLQQLTLGPASLAKVETTAEGGAIVVGNAASAPYAWLVPSTSMTSVPVVIDDAGFVAAPRGSTTFVFAYPPPGTGAPAVYAYDELAGARLTKVSADLANGFGNAILSEAGLPATAWFRYGTPGNCRIGRIVYAGTTPSISSQLCGDDSAISVVGARPNGDLIARSSSRVWVVTDFADAVAEDDYGTIGIAYDTGAWPFKVVGWFGKQTGGKDFACLASHPDRCWKVSSGDALRLLPADAAANGGEGTFAFSRTEYEDAPNRMRTTIFRSIGTGDTTQPLP